MKMKSNKKEINKFQYKERRKLEEEFENDTTLQKGHYIFTNLLKLSNENLCIRWFAYLNAIYISNFTTIRSTCLLKRKNNCHKIAVF